MSLGETMGEVDEWYCVKKEQKLARRNEDQGNCSTRVYHRRNTRRM